MTASYSASLLDVWNPNMRAYSMSIPSGEVRIRPAPLPCAFEAPSTEFPSGEVSRRLGIPSRFC